MFVAVLAWNLYLVEAYIIQMISDQATRGNPMTSYTQRCARTAEESVESDQELKAVELLMGMDLRTGQG